MPNGILEDAVSSGGGAAEDMPNGILEATGECEADDQEAGTGDLMIVSQFKNPVFSSPLQNLRLLENFNRLPKEKRAEKEPYCLCGIP